MSNPNPVSSLKTSRYRPEIDGLRAFAVVAVIINHFNKDILPGGYLGVDVFFVISGYVITSSLFGRTSKDFKDFISAFYERRIKRLVPALSVFVLITSIAICLFNPSPEKSLETGLSSLFGLSNLYLLSGSTDYFARSTELNVFTHTWSLGVEEQFYILFPFLIWFSGFGRQTKNGARNLFFTIVVLSISSLIGFLYLYPVNQSAAYFLMPSRFWEMAAGCLMFIGLQKRVFIEQFLEKVPPFLVLPLIVGVMFLPSSLAVTSTIAIVVLSCILIVCLKKKTAAFKVFTNPQVVYIGLISYSLYLWHWGVLSISRWTIGIHWWSVPFQVALMLGLAIASYRWIETPLRKGNWFGKRWKTLVVGGGVLAALSGVLIAVIKPLKGNFFIGGKENMINDRFSIYSEFDHWNHHECGTSRRKSKKVSSADFKRCWVGDPLRDSVNNRSKISVFAYGNSYNQQLVPAYLGIVSLNNEYEFNAFFAAGCTASSLFIHDNETTPGYCRYVYTQYLNWVKSVAKPGDIFLLANSYSKYSQSMRLGLDTNVRASGREILDAYSIELSGLEKDLSRLGIRIYITSPIPSLKADPILCRYWFAAYNSKCKVLLNKNKSEKLINTYNALKAKVSQPIKDFSFIDIYSILNAKLVSSPNPYIYYFNEGHLSRLGAKLLEEEIYSSF